MSSITVELVIHAADAAPPPVISPDLPKRIDLLVGQSFDLAPFFSDVNNYPLIYSLAAPSELVSISPAGMLTAIKAGSGTATVVVDNGH